MHATPDPGRFPGADIIVATTPGSTLDAVPEKEKYRLAADRDPLSVPTWVAKWATIMHEEGAPGLTGTTTRDHLLFLSQLATWIANALDEDLLVEYAADLGRIVRTLARLTGDTLPPIRWGVPCLDCGAGLLLRWGKDGLSDVPTCPKCGRCYETPTDRYAAIRALLARAPELAPDLEITETEAVKIFPTLRKGDVRTWVHKGTLTPTRRGDNHTPARYTVRSIATRLGITTGEESA